VRDPISRFQSAYDWEVSVVLAPAATHCQLGPNCPAPLRQARKFSTGHVYDRPFEDKLLHFHNANHVAESLFQASLDGKIANDLMTDPHEHLFKGIGWYLYNGSLVRRHRERMFVGTVENMNADVARLARLLHVNLSTVPRMRTTAHNHSISPLGRHNLRRWYNKTDYAALRELVRCGLLDANSIQLE